MGGNYKRGCLYERKLYVGERVICESEGNDWA